MATATVSASAIHIYDSGWMYQNDAGIHANGYGGVTRVQYLLPTNNIKITNVTVGDTTSQDNSVIYGISGNISLLCKASTSADDYTTSIPSGYTSNSIYMASENWTKSVFTITNAFDSNMLYGGVVYLYFLHNNSSGNSNSFLHMVEPVLKITYDVVSHTATVPPTVISIDTPSIPPNTSAVLSWSGAQGGISNEINGYDIYRSTTEADGYTLLFSIVTAETSGSTEITSPEIENVTYYYRIITKGIAGSDYYSGLSSIYATLTSVEVTDCTPPETLSVSPSSVFPGGSATLSWSNASGGTNNTIIGYDVYRAESPFDTYSLLASIESTNFLGSIYVSASEDGGVSYRYKILTRGSAGESYYSDLSEVYATLTSRVVSACIAPSSVLIEPENVFPESPAILSWSGASGGSENAIIGYDVYRASSSDGEYVFLASIDTSDTFGSLSVVSDSIMNATFYYKVLTRGELDNEYNSELSTESAVLTTMIVTACFAPTIITTEPSNVPLGTTALLTWGNALGGTNNAISGYDIYKATSVDGEYSLLATIQSENDMGAITITASESVGESFYYKIVTKGVAGIEFDSQLSDAFALLTARPAESQIRYWTEGEGFVPCGLYYFVDYSFKKCTMIQYTNGEWQR